MDWTYKNQLLSDEMIPEKAIGFIYIITHTTSGKKYLGRKLLTKAHRRQKNNKIIKSRVQSDWRDYYSSSPFLIEMVEQEGKDNFTREVLYFVENKSALIYAEEKFQYVLGVLESDEWLNSNIRAKLFSRVVMKMDVEELNNTLTKLKGNS